MSVSSVFFPSVAIPKFSHSPQHFYSSRGIKNKWRFSSMNPHKFRPLYKNVCVSIPNFLSQLLVSLIPSYSFQFLYLGSTSYPFLSPWPCLSSLYLQHLCCFHPLSTCTGTFVLSLCTLKWIVFTLNSFF